MPVLPPPIYLYKINFIHRGEEEKQKSKNSYKFVVGKNKSIEFNSNTELLRLIIENEACNEEYKRHFKLNKLLR
jgi:hypothetical protein